MGRLSDTLAIGVALALIVAMVGAASLALAHAFALVAGALIRASLQGWVL